MQWTTMAHVHLDRVAAPWLIRRFVDSEAEFDFVVWGEDGELPTPELLGQVPTGSTPLGIPGAKLGSMTMTAAALKRFSASTS